MQVESALTAVIVEPLKKRPDALASFIANSAAALISGVRDSIGPVNPTIMPNLTSSALALAAVAITATTTAAMRICLFIGTLLYETVGAGYPSMLILKLPSQHYRNIETPARVLGAPRLGRQQPVPAPPRQADRHDRRASRSSRPQRYRCRTRRSRPGTGHAPPPGRPGRGRAGARNPRTAHRPDARGCRNAALAAQIRERAATWPRPLVPRSRISSGNSASSVHPEAATVSPAPASAARTRYRKPLPPRTPRERR